MKASELRIGNFVAFRTNKAADYREKRALKAREIMQIEADKELAKPIALTEEWVLKFGFEEYYWSGYFSINNSKYVLRSFKESFALLIPCKSKCKEEQYEHELVCDNIKYVNQLQNIYFALTGEELIIKE